MLHVLFLNNRNCYQKICIINNGTFSLFAQFLVRFKDLIDWKLCWISLVQIVWLLSGWLDFEVSYSLTYVLDLLITFTPVYVLHAGSLVDSLLNFNECMKQNDYKIIWTMRFFYMKWQLFFYIAYMIVHKMTGFRWAPSQNTFTVQISIFHPVKKVLQKKRSNDWQRRLPNKNNLKFKVKYRNWKKKNL